MWAYVWLNLTVGTMPLSVLMAKSLLLSLAPGYAPQSLSTQREYQLNFRIINWNLSNPDPTSLEYTALWRDIQDKVVSLSPVLSLLALGAPVIPLIHIY